MAKHTARDRVWNAALNYGKEWDDLDFDERRTKYGFTASELIEKKDLEASEKTVTDTLLTMTDMGWFRRVGGKGGEPSEFIW